ncbi:hypothetical protein JCM11641_000028 [Rhodosporidiobolus odoratus]
MLSLFSASLAGAAAFLLGASSVQAYGTGFTNQKVVSAYYPSYQMDPAAVPYSLYTHLDYFVFTTTSSPSAISQAGIDDSLISNFVNRAHAAGTTVSYTVGGWTGSQYFSPHVSTAANRATFARTLVAVMNRYGFDGIDIDWEYPGNANGEGDNIWSTADAANLVLFLQTLRSVAGVNARLSMAVSVSGVTGADGNPLKDMRDFAAVLDYITIMSYDITGTWSGYTGPNTPLYSTCAPADNKFSIDSGIRLYSAAGFSTAHMLIGFPAYSYSYYVTSPLAKTTCTDGTTSTLYQYPTKGSKCGNYIGNGPQYLYSQLVANNWFKSQTGFRRIFDKPSYTWTLWNPSTNLYIPTETPITAWAKARSIFQRRCAGVNMFDASGDTPTGSLATALRIGLHIDKTSTVPAQKRAKRHLEEKKRKRSSALH